MHKVLSMVVNTLVVEEILAQKRKWLGNKSNRSKKKKFKDNNPKQCDKLHAIDSSNVLKIL